MSSCSNFFNLAIESHQGLNFHMAVTVTCINLWLVAIKYEFTNLSHQSLMKTSVGDVCATDKTCQHVQLTNFQHHLDFS